MENVNFIDNIDKEKEIPLKRINRFFIGIIGYTITSTLFPSFTPIIGGSIINLFQLIFLLLTLFYGLRLISFRNISSIYLRMVIVVLFIWISYIIYNGLILNYSYIKEYLFQPYRALHYLMPFVVFFPVSNSQFLQKTLTFCYKLGVIFLVGIPFLSYFLLNYQTFSEHYVWTFATGSGFILLTSYYHPKKKIFISLLVVILGILLMTLMARRNLMLTYGGFLFAAFLLYVFINKNISLKKKGVILFLSVGLLIFGYYIFMSSSMFWKISARATEDTREEVLISYASDMEDRDWFIGKGINGSYYAPGVDSEWAGMELEYRDLDYRFLIEMGYLQLILNGGLIYLILYLMILIPAIIKGLFFSNNFFTKACATLIFLWLIDMVPFGLPIFTFRYFLVWFCVAICYCKPVRTMKEKEFKAQFF